MRDLFIEFKRNRYEWAFDAKHDFMSRFQLYDVEGVRPNQENIVLSVYGPTQVGKTTLILNLLGVKEGVIDDISTFLRGKREIGQSATVTVTSYRVSSTEDYVLTLPDGEPEVIQTMDVLGDRLSSLRADVEAGRIDALAPVLIALPNSYFEQTDVAIELLDLPGIESSEEREIQHVERCVNHWIPQSHVCLIVNGAGDLTFLRDIGMSHLKHWYDYPDNFYVVLTRAYSPESVKRRLRDGSIANEEDLRAYYSREIGDILGRPPGTVYPVEIGASLHRLQATEREIAKGVLDELRARIKQTDYRHISFNFLTGYYAEIIRKSDEEIRHLTEDVEMAEREQVRLKQQLEVSKKRASSRVGKLQRQTELLNEKISAFQAVYVEVGERDETEEEIEGALDKVKYAKSKAALNATFSNLVASFENTLHEKVDKMNRLLSTIYFEIEVGESYFEVVRPEELVFCVWDNSKVDFYLSQKNYETQMELMRQELRQGVMGMSEMIRDEAEKINSQLQDVFDRLKATSRRTALRFEHELEIFDVEMEEAEQNVALLQKRLTETRARWQEDLTHARRYRSFFIEHFTRRHQELLRQAASDDIRERYSAGLYLYTLGQDAEEIIQALGCPDGNETA